MVYKSIIKSHLELDLELNVKDLQQKGEYLRESVKIPKNLRSLLQDDLSLRSSRPRLMSPEAFSEVDLEHQPKTIWMELCWKNAVVNQPFRAKNVSNSIIELSGLPSRNSTRRWKTNGFHRETSTVNQDIFHFRTKYWTFQKLGIPKPSLSPSKIFWRFWGRHPF